MQHFKTSFLYLIKIHVLGLLTLTILRIGLFFVGYSFIDESSRDEIVLILTAFVRGLWFDNVIGCYLLILPLFAFLIGYEFGYMGKLLVKSVTRFLQVMWAVVFFVSAADIPYFKYFFKHLNASIWNWAEYGGTGIGMILGEPSYYPPLLFFILLVCLFVLFTNKWKKKVICAHLSLSYKSRILGDIIGLLLIGFCIFGIRGRTGYNPIKVSAAYYCEDSFLNQLGVNPTFNLLTSTLDGFRPENKELHLMDTKEALLNVEEYYSWDKDSIQTDSVDVMKKNVVLILMESMSAHLMGTFGNNDNLTPFLDSLAQHSILFTNCYSAGIHTNHGIFSTLYSYPALMGRNMMKGTIIPHYEGLPTELKKQGYRTMFFMTHESQYDNMNAFLRTNGFDEIYSQENYPSDKVANSFGVQDDFLFSYAHRKLNATCPFFATLLTISNHPPYIIPKWFKARNTDTEKAIVEYADYSLQQFFAVAKRQPWYENTVFVLLGDHGKLITKAENEMPQSYNHIPLIVFSPGMSAQKVEGWATQTDVQRTILNILGIQSNLKNFSKDLLHDTRSCVIYTADDVMGARTDNHLFIYRPSTKQEFLYKTNILSHKRDSIFDSLRHILFSHLQAMQFLSKEHE